MAATTYPNAPTALQKVGPSKGVPFVQEVRDLHLCGIRPTPPVIGGGMTADHLGNPWHRLPRQAPFVLPEDAERVAALANGLRAAVRAEQRAERDGQPQQLPGGAPCGERFDQLDRRRFPRRQRIVRSHLAYAA